MGFLSRREYLSKAIDLTGKYKELIEERISTDLGEIEVRDMRRAIISEPIKDFRRLVRENSSDLSNIAISTTIAAPIVLPILIAKMIIGGKNSPGLFSEPNIFFNCRKQFRVEASQEQSTFVDQVAVHELTHALWYSLGGEYPTTENPRSQLMTEGFATYGHTYWFSDFYPFQSELDLSGYWGSPAYLAGALRMRSIVEEHGEDVLLEVPYKWRELDKATPLSEPEAMASSQEQLEAFEGERTYSD